MGLRKLVLVAGLAMATAVLVLPPAAGAPDRARARRTFDHRRVLGADYEKVGESHYKIRLRDGKVVHTHGPDFAESHGTSLGPGDPERPPVCATDYYQHVLYGRPVTSTDRYDSVKPQIQAIVRRMNAVLNESSLESGNKTADYKVLCDASGQIQVDKFTNAAGASFSEIINAAKAAGFNKPSADYTILYDGAGPSGTCGIGTIYEDERLTSSNYNNVYTGFGVSYSGCWESTPMHENGHNQGAVQYYAPNGTGDGYHCQDEIDVMCYADGGNRYTGIVNRCTDKLHFDCGNDDYFDSAPEPGEYLESHWNMGSPLNRFVAFGGATQPPPPPPPTDPDPATPTLTNGVVRSDVNGSGATWKYYKIFVPSVKSRLAVVLDGPSCSYTYCTPNLNLYVRRASKPTTYYYACRSIRSYSSDESCTVLSPSSGYWYYVGVYVYRGPSGKSYTIKATYS